MRNLRLLLPIAGVGLALGFLGCGRSTAPPATETDRAKLHALVVQAEAAYAQGDLRLAKELLNTLSGKVSGEQNSAAIQAAFRLKFVRAVELIGWVFVVWVGVGFLGQALFCARFVVQWLASEKHKRSVVPVAFWYLSLSGSLVVLSYAIWRLDPVFILAYSLNLFIYVRNLMLIHRAHPAASPAGSQEGRT